MPGRNHIRRAQHVAEAGEMAFEVPSGPLPDQDGFSTELFFYFLEFPGDRIQCLVPGDPLPALPGFLHGVKDPIGMVCQLGNSQPF